MGGSVSLASPTQRLQYSPLQLNATGRRKIPSSLGCWRCRRPRMSSRAAVFVKFQTGGAVEQLQLQLQLGGLPSALGPFSPTALRQDEQRLVTASGRPGGTGEHRSNTVLTPFKHLLGGRCLDVLTPTLARPATRLGA